MLATAAGRLFVVEQQGRIRILETTACLARLTPLYQFNLDWRGGAMTFPGTAEWQLLAPFLDI